MEEALSKNERWGNEISAREMVSAAVIQMQDSGLFDHGFLMLWEMKEDVEKTWAEMKQYFTEEYRAIQQFGGANPDVLESANLMEQARAAAEVFEEIRRDAMVNTEQIQLMATLFKGATNTMTEVIERLKTAMEDNKVLTRTVSTLTNTNKQLVETNKQLTTALAALGGKAPAKPPAKPAEQQKQTGGEGGGWKKALPASTSTCFYLLPTPLDTIFRTNTPTA